MDVGRGFLNGASITDVLGQAVDETAVSGIKQVCEDDVSFVWIAR